MSTSPPEIKPTYVGSDHPTKAKQKTNQNLRTLLKSSFWIPKATVVGWIGLFKTYTVFKHRFKSAPLFLPHKRKANLCLMVNNFWQLLPFKLLRAKMTIWRGKLQIT